MRRRTGWLALALVGDLLVAATAHAWPSPLSIETPVSSPDEPPLPTPPPLPPGDRHGAPPGDPTKPTTPTTPTTPTPSSAAQVADAEAPVRRSPTPEPPPPLLAPDRSEMPVRISGNFVGARVSIARGGDPVLTIQNPVTGTSEPALPAGNGKMVALVAAATFNWWGRVGWGIGAELGWKEETVAAYGGTVTLRRFPASATIHLIAQAAKPAFLTASAGIVFEVAPELITVNGPESDVSLGSRFGRVYEAGYHHALGSNFTIDTGLRLTVIKCEMPDGALVDALNLSVALGGSYHFDR